jgi:hypothetical protein
MGMTLGILDAAAAAECETIEQYQSERSCYVVELLTNVLYHVLQRDDESARRVRRSLFELLRSDPSERLRTMRILTGEDENRSSFVATFAKVSGRSLRSSLPARMREPGRKEALLEDMRWLKWPLSAALASEGTIQGLRHSSTFEQPWTQGAGLISQRVKRELRALLPTSLRPTP